VRKKLIVSFPRSGHQLLVGMMQKYYGDEMVYCEMYSHCGQVWCPDPETTVQRTHDLDLDVPIDLDVDYVIQLRNAGAAIEAWYKSAVAEGETDLSWPDFKEEKMAFYDAWIRKWTKPNGPDAPHIRYEILVEHPAAVLCAAIGEGCNERRARSLAGVMDIHADRAGEK
jgi:hypothetical protein